MLDRLVEVIKDRHKGWVKARHMKHMWLIRDIEVSGCFAYCWRVACQVNSSSRIRAITDFYDRDTRQFLTLGKHHCGTIHPWIHWLYKSHFCFIGFPNSVIQFILHLESIFHFFLCIQAGFPVRIRWSHPLPNFWAHRARRSAKHAHQIRRQQASSNA